MKSVHKPTEGCSKAGEDYLDASEDFPDVDLKIVKTIQMLNEGCLKAGETYTDADTAGCLDGGEEYKDADCRLSRCW